MATATHGLIGPSRENCSVLSIVVGMGIHQPERASVRFEPRASALRLIAPRFEVDWWPKTDS